MKRNILTIALAIFTIPLFGQGFTVKNKDITMHYQDEINIVFNNTPPSDISCSTENKFVAGIDKINGEWVISAMLIGKTQIIVKNKTHKEVINVNVSPRYNLFSKPLPIGSDEKQIPAFHLGENLNTTYSPVVRYKQYTLFYKVENKKITAYFFHIEKNSFAPKSILNYLGERYVPIDKSKAEEDTYYFATRDKKEIITVKINKKGEFSILHTPAGKINTIN